MANRVKVGGRRDGDAFSIASLLTTEREATVVVSGREYRVKRWCSIGDYEDLRKHVEGRMQMLELSHGKLPVEFPQDAPVPKWLLEERGELKQEKVVLYLTSLEEINTATALELGLVDPKLSWQEAVLLTLASAHIALPLAQKIITEVNVLGALEEEKKI